MLLDEIAFWIFVVVFSIMAIYGIGLIIIGFLAYYLLKDILEEED